MENLRNKFHIYGGIKMEEKYVVKKPPKSPGLAGVLSFFFPFGTGQLYNGQPQKALIFFLIFAGLVTLQTTGEGQPFLGLCLGAFYIYQIIEAVQTAKRINMRVLAGEGYEEEAYADEVPELVKSGSIFWGAFLMIVGLVLLLANFEVINYSTVFDLWPLIIIIIGVKLVAEYLTQKGKSNNSERRS